MNSITLAAPATVANLSCGFDVLGLCLNTPYDEIEVIKNPDRKITLDILESQYDNIPKNVDEYLNNLSKFGEQDNKGQLTNSAWHIHSGEPPEETAYLSYNILLNLAAVCNTENKDVLWHFISRYQPNATPENAPTLDRLTEYAIEYFRDFVKPHKEYRPPTEIERAALTDLIETLIALPKNTGAEGIQTQVYEVGKRHAFENLRSWFTTLYETLLGQPTGPRMGSFIALFGIDEYALPIDSDSEVGRGDEGGPPMTQVSQMSPGSGTDSLLDGVFSKKVIV